MVRSLDRLLGRSVVDPEVAQAYEAGQVELLLKGYDFPNQLRTELLGLEASSFKEFAAEAFKLASRWDGPEDTDPDPWPTEGLPARLGRERRRIARSA